VERLPTPAREVAVVARPRALVLQVEPNRLEKIVLTMVAVFDIAAVVALFYESRRS
jgi:hypothetical protein